MSAEQLLEEARGALDRVEPHELADLPNSLVVDIRPHHNRAAEGEIPGALPVERIVLEWRLDPAGEHRIPGFTADTTVVVVCNEGYASSLAARDLQRVGLPNATDLVGGFRAYAAAGLPVHPTPTPPIT
ncbi:rhodanese-like domain-containing protein [Saccharothrix sp. BKS2]|uniref:rhodanese-like domain-containing protein n=1 Tax=Saccharothrix sp. BKS2 TaxID=3064400 RepID=UPI0039EC64E0